VTDDVTVKDTVVKGGAWSGGTGWGVVGVCWVVTKFSTKKWGDTEIAE